MVMPGQAWPFTEWQCAYVPGERICCPGPGSFDAILLIASCASEKMVTHSRILFLLAHQGSWLYGQANIGSVSAWAARRSQLARRAKMGDPMIPSTCSILRTFFWFTRTRIPPIQTMSV